MMTEKKEINKLALLGAVVASTAFGFIWYMEPVFGGAWMDLAGVPRSTSVPMTTLLISLLFKAVFNTGAAYILARVMKRMQVQGSKAGALLGLGLGTVAFILLMDGFYAARPLNVFLIDGGHQILSFGIMGAILGKER